MTVETARTILETMIAAAPEPWRGITMRALEELETAEERRRRYERQKKRAQRATGKGPPDTPRVPGSVPDCPAMSPVVPDEPNAAPHDLPSPLLSSLSSSSDLSLSALSPSEKPSQTAGGGAGKAPGAGARGHGESGQRAAGNGAHGASAVPVLSLTVPVARGTKSSRIPADWQPSRELVAWCEQQGVDAAAAVPDFRGFWEDEADQRKKRAFKSASGWERTFKNHVLFLLEKGRAPSLPPAAPPPAPVGDPSQARSVRDVLSGLARPAILEAKEASRG